MPKNTGVDGLGIESQRFLWGLPWNSDMEKDRKVCLIASPNGIYLLEISWIFAGNKFFHFRYNLVLTGKGRRSAECDASPVRVPWV